MVYYSGYSYVWGSSSGSYVWQADTTTLSLYEPDTTALKVHGTYDYIFPDNETLMLNSSQYELQH